MTGSAWKLSAAAVLVCVVSAPATLAAAPVPKEAGGRNADAKQRIRSQNNLKIILLAIHNYHDANNSWPQDVVDKDGKALLSWRVLILPYLEHDNLYRQFKLDEPWDSDNNKKLLAKMPGDFRVGFEEKGETKTYYRGFSGKGAVFEPGAKLTLVTITDGSSNTLAVAEAGPPVEWTKPSDIPYDAKNDLPKLEGPFNNVLLAATADGAAHSLKRDIDEKTFRRLIERADGEVVDLDEVRIKFPLTPEEVKEALEILKENEKLLTAITDQFKEQQKLLQEALKQPKVNSGVFDEILRRQRDLKSAVEELKRDTEELKLRIEEAVGPAKPGPKEPELKK